MMDGRRIGRGLGIGRGVGSIDMGRRQSAPNPRGHAYGLRTGGDPDRGLGNRQSLPGTEKVTHAGRARGFRAAPLPVPPAQQVNPGAFGHAILPPASGGGQPIVIPLLGHTGAGTGPTAGPILGTGLVIGRVRR